MTIAPEDVLHLYEAEVLALNAELGEDSRGASDVFSRLDGLEDDLPTAQDRRFVLVPTSLPRTTGVAGTAQISFEIASVYALNTASVTRALRDSDRLRDAGQRLLRQPGISLVVDNPREPVYDPANGVLIVVRELVVDYYAADLRRPGVESTAPSALATGVSTATSVVLTFTKPMTAFTPSLVDQAGDAVAATPVWSNGGRRVTLTPDAPLDAMTIYVCTVGRGETSADGQPIRGAFELRFCTEA